MDYAEFASDVAVDHALTTGSAEENQEVMRRFGVDQRVRQLGRGRFRSDLAFQITEQAALCSDRFSTACSVRLEPPAGSTVILFPRTVAGDFLTCGHGAADAGLVVLPSGSVTDFKVSALSGSEGIAVPAARLAEMTHALCPTLDETWPERTVLIRGHRAPLLGLQRAVLGLATRRAAPHAEHVSHLVAETVAWMGRYSGRSGPERVTAIGSRRRIAKRAQEFIEDHYRGAVHLADLCRETGVGARHLQRIFRGHFGITITDYLKTVRLDAAYRALSAAPASPGAIARIAFDHGFAHLGRFSVEFRDRFGESPSEMLARRQPEPAGMFRGDTGAAEHAKASRQGTQESPPHTVEK